MGLHFFLIDFENVQPSGIGSLVPGHCKIMIFLGQNQTKVPLDLSRVLQPFGVDVEYLQIVGNGPNAVDFHIAFYVGRLAASHPDAKFTIVSKDTGFDPLVRHLAGLKIACNRTATINGSVKVSSSKAASVIKPALKSAVAAKPKIANNVVVEILPEGNGIAIKAKPLLLSKTARVAEVIERLKGLKAARPAKLKSLQSSLKSWFKPALKPDEVASVIAALQGSRKIRVEGTKVIYTL